MQRGQNSKAKQSRDSKVSSSTTESSSLDDAAKSDFHDWSTSSSERGWNDNDDSLLTLMAAWARGQVPSLYIRMGPYICVLISFMSAVVAHLWQNYQFFRRAVVIWLISEVAWYVYFKTKLMYQLTLFVPEDSKKKLSQNEIDRILDNVIFLVRNGKTPTEFWNRATGVVHKHGEVPLAVVICYLKSVLFVFDSDSCYSQKEKDKILKHSIGRLEEPSGGFDAASKSNVASSLIKSWRDNDLLYTIVQHTPLLMLIYSFFVRWSSFFLIWIFGWRRGYLDPESKLECWIKRPRSFSSNIKSTEDARPIILFPGAGFGLTSFLPLALLFQFTFSNRTIVLFRFPWVEMCIPWTTLPQWSDIIRGVLIGLNKLGLGNSELDLVGHSYGTAVANRLLRELCNPTLNSKENSNNSTSSSSFKYPKIYSLSLFDPIVLGGAQTGLSSFIINNVSPDLSFAFCGNRAGVSNKEVFDYNPKTYGQCLGGMSFYVSAYDVLLDIKLARYILLNNVDPNLKEAIDGGSIDDTRLIADRTPNSFHGRWLVEIWFLGPLWKSPCSTRSLKLLYSQLRRKTPTNLPGK